MRRVLVIVFATCTLVGAVTVVAVVGRDSETPHFCPAGAKISTRFVVVDGTELQIGFAEDEKMLLGGCNSYAAPVVLPNCDVWDGGSNSAVKRIRTLEPFYVNGTCSSRGGGALRDDAPRIICRDPKDSGIGCSD